MDITKKKDNVTLSVSADVDSNLADTEKRDILMNFLSLSNTIYRELGLEIFGNTDFFLSLSNGKEILRHFGIDHEEEARVFESAKIAMLFTVLSCTDFSAPTRFIIDFDPHHPYSVIRQMGISIDQQERVNTQ